MELPATSWNGHHIPSCGREFLSYLPVLHDFPSSGMSLLPFHLPETTSSVSLFGAGLRLFLTSAFLLKMGILATLWGYGLAGVVHKTFTHSEAEMHALRFLLPPRTVSITHTT